MNFIKYTQEVTTNKELMHNAYLYLEAYGELPEEDRPDGHRSHNSVISIMSDPETFSDFYDVLEAECDYFGLDVEKFVTYVADCI